MDLSRKLQSLMDADLTITSQSDLAEKTGLTKQAVSLLLSGKRKRLRKDTITKICNYFKIKPEEFMGIKAGYSISDELKFLMSLAQMNEYELARRSGLHRMSIRNILINEDTYPFDETLIPICRVFGISLKQIRGEVDINYIEINK